MSDELHQVEALAKKAESAGLLDLKPLMLELVKAIIIWMRKQEKRT